MDLSRFSVGVLLMMLPACGPATAEVDAAELTGDGPSTSSTSSSETTSGSSATGTATTSSSGTSPSTGAGPGSATEVDGSSSEGSSAGVDPSSSSGAESSSSGGEPACGGPDPVSCDVDDDDPWHALGLNCEAGPAVDGLFVGAEEQLYVHQGNFGTSDEFAPREGEKFVILSSGVAEQMVTNVGGTVSTAMGGKSLADLPAPMTYSAVSDIETCLENPALVGTGDCSNSIEPQFEQGGDANDLAFLHFSAVVPENTYGFSYDFAFFSVEYPVYFQTQYNDMYVAWLESEGWTGNVSFDALGYPVSLNSGFLELKDVPEGVPFDPDCEDGCMSPELADTAAQGHAGTRWLTTNAPVVPGETIEVYFAIFDLADTALDSAVILDNWLWTCEGGAPVTIPG